jgi:ribosomal protein L17
MKEKITDNYCLSEFVYIYGVPAANKINEKAITKEQIAFIKSHLAPLAQQIRNEINAEFREMNGGEIRLRITSGFRAKEWDISRGRSGNGEHPKGTAIDVQPIGCHNDEMYMKVFNWIANKYKDHNGGFALKNPTTANDKIVSFGFIHFDFRGFRARGTY